MLVADQMSSRDSLPTVALAGVVGRVESLRAIKDEGEVDAIRAAIRAAERAFRDAPRWASTRPNPEIQAASLLESYLKPVAARPGRRSTRSWRPGPGRPALSCATPSVEGRLGDHAFVLVDWGATVSGYRSDLTRMIATGNVGEEFGRVYRAVRWTPKMRAIAARSGPECAGSRRRCCGPVGRSRGPVSAACSVTDWDMGSAWQCMSRRQFGPTPTPCSRPEWSSPSSRRIYRPGWGGIPASRTRRPRHSRRPRRADHPAQVDGIPCFALISNTNPFSKPRAESGSAPSAGPARPPFPKRSPHAVRAERNPRGPGRSPPPRSPYAADTT